MFVLIIVIHYYTYMVHIEVLQNDVLKAATEKQT